MAHGQTQTLLRIPEARLTTGSNGTEKRVSTLWWFCLCIVSAFCSVGFSLSTLGHGSGLNYNENKLTRHDLVEALGL